MHHFILLAFVLLAVYFAVNALASKAVEEEKDYDEVISKEEMEHLRSRRLTEECKRRGAL